MPDFGGIKGITEKTINPNNPEKLLPPLSEKIIDVFEDILKEKPEAPLTDFEKKFDIDGDGKLDEREKSALDAYKEKDFEKKFDIDGDGKLDEKELAALNAYREAEKGKNTPKFPLDPKFFPPELPIEKFPPVGLFTENDKNWVECNMPINDPTNLKLPE